MVNNISFKGDLNNPAIVDDIMVETAESRDRGELTRPTSTSDV